MAYVIILAQEEACLMGHRHIWTHQILLGLIREHISTASRVLRSMGINLEDARDEVEEILGLGNGFGGDNISLARRARGAYELRIRQHEEMQEWWERNGIGEQANIPFAQMFCELSLEEARQLGQGNGFVGRGVFIPLTSGAQRFCVLSLEEARRLGHNNVRSEHLLLTLLREGVAARVLEILGADLTHIRTEMIRILRMEDESMEAVGGSGQKMPMLDVHGTNLTELAKEGKLDPVVGRQEQIEQVTQILSRRTKNNPCLIGEPGVGKTAIAEGLAQRIATGDVPETVEGKKIITLEKFLLVARTKYLGGYCGEFEEQLKKLMEEIKQAEDIILFIGKVHTLIGTRANEGVTNILRSALARGELQCIGATTLDEYRKHIKKDPALERMFQPVKVPEPTVDETIQILKGLRQRYEIIHNLRYTDEALVAAAQLSNQYISDRLPAKAIDLIDEAGSHVRHKAGELRNREVELRAQMAALSNKDKAIEAENKAEETGPMVTEADIQHIVSSWTGIPVEKVSSESSRLLRMEETLHSRIIGQDEAVKAISRAIHSSRVWPKNPNRLIASFIFSGPTGVGKSDLAKALASFYFGSEEAMIQLDMSQFMESHTVSKLIGSPPGYTEGGQLTEAVRIRTYTVILFDKIEKAHPDVFNMILQILEDGQLTDSKGRTVDFKNTLLIMTSNVGSSVIEKGGRKIRFDHESADKKDRRYNRIKSLVTEELKQYFRPEFLNRLDEMIVFRQLTKLEAKEIADIMLKELIGQQKKKDIDVQFTDKFRDRVVDEGYNPSYGAKPLRKKIMRFLEDSLMRKELGGGIKKGNSVIVDVDSEGKIVVLGGESRKGGGGDGGRAGVIWWGFRVFCERLVGL